MGHKRKQNKSADKKQAIKQVINTWYILLNIEDQWVFRDDYQSFDGAAINHLIRGKLVEEQIVLGRPQIRRTYDGRRFLALE